MLGMVKKSSGPDLSTLTHAEKDALISALLARLEVLESLVRKDSHNSSKPPSTDGLAKKKTSSLRKASGKNVGGQKGHDGTTLKQVAQPTEIVLHPLPARCNHCNNVTVQPQAGCMGLPANACRNTSSMPWPCLRRVSRQERMTAKF